MHPGVNNHRADVSLWSKSKNAFTHHFDLTVTHVAAPSTRSSALTADSFELPSASLALRLARMARMPAFAEYKRARARRDSVDAALDTAPPARRRLVAFQYEQASLVLKAAHGAYSRAMLDTFGASARAELSDLYAHTVRRSSADDTTPNQRLARRVLADPGKAFVSYRSKLVSALVQASAREAARRKTDEDKAKIPVVFTSLGHLWTKKALEPLGGGPSGDAVVAMSCVFLRSEIAMLRRMDDLMAADVRSVLEDHPSP